MEYNKGIRRCTFNGSPLGLPPQQPPPIDLILLVTAHHSKRDHLLLRGRRSTDSEVRNHTSTRKTVNDLGVAACRQTELRMLSQISNICQRKSFKMTSHPDLLINHSVLCILIEFLLRVYVDPIGSQLFPYLTRACSNKYTTNL